MIGSDYKTIEKFVEACNKPEEELDAGLVLSKIYSVDSIKEIAHKLSPALVKKLDSDRKGIGKRYEMAEKVAGEFEADKIGETLSVLDHGFYENHLSYVKMGNEKAFESPENFIQHLKTKRIIVNNGFKYFFNGLTKPPGRRCKLESIKTHDDSNEISLVFSCTRVLMRPEATMHTHKNMFLGRVPIIVRLLFDYRLVEFSIPFYSDPLASLFPGWDNIMPGRFQHMVSQALKGLHDLDLKFTAVNFTQLLLFLEIKKDAEDMGWKINPLEEAAFDLKQNVLPLRQIFGSFTNSLKEELKFRKIDHHPLADANLYEIFRAIKEKSYTYAQVLKVHYSKRGSHLLTIIYGHKDSASLPLIFISKNNSTIIRNLRESIVESGKKEINNPYDFTTIITAPKNNDE